MPRKVFVANEILTAADVNTNLMDQSVMVFDDDAARTAAIPTPSEGMVTYLKDANQVSAFTGSAFTAVGGILQVVSTTKTDTFQSSSTTFTDVTGLTATITPTSTSSKVFVLVQFMFATSGVTSSAYYKIAGGNTATYVGDAGGNRIQTVGGMHSNNANYNQFGGTLTVSFLDSPATTSATTYSLQVRGKDGDAFINRNNTDTDSDFFPRGASSITVMEVAG